MLKRRAVSTAMLVSCALIWGTSYIAQILGMQEIGPLTFCASRYVVSVAALSLMLALMGKRGGFDEARGERTPEEKCAERIVIHHGSALLRHHRHSGCRRTHHARRQ